MTAEEKAAKKAAEAAAAGNVVIAELLDPKQETLIGSIEMINFKEANSEKGGKFNKDTFIVALSIPKIIDGVFGFESKNVFITAKQFKEYGCESVIYTGNYVRMTVEHCVKDVTGYKENADDEELTAHTNTFDAFVGVTSANADVLMMYLESVGVTERMTDRIIASVSRLRETRDALKEGTKAFNSPFGG